MSDYEDKKENNYEHARKHKFTEIADEFLYFSDKMITKKTKCASLNPPYHAIEMYGWEFYVNLYVLLLKNSYFNEKPKINEQLYFEHEYNKLSYDCTYCESCKRIINDKEFFHLNFNRLRVLFKVTIYYEYYIMHGEKRNILELLKIYFIFLNKEDIENIIEAYIESLASCKAENINKIVEIICNIIDILLKIKNINQPSMCLRNKFYEKASRVAPPTKNYCWAKSILESELKSDTKKIEDWDRLDRISFIIDKIANLKEMAMKRNVQSKDIDKLCDDVYERYCNHSQIKVIKEKLYKLVS